MSQRCARVAVALTLVTASVPAVTASDVRAAEPVSPPRTELLSVSSKEVQANGRSATPNVSDDGRFVAFTSSASNLLGSAACADKNTVADVFVRDRLRGMTERVHDAKGGELALGAAVRHLSPDGRWLIFESVSTNLPGQGQYDGIPNLYRLDRSTGITRWIDRGLGGAQADSPGHIGGASADGRWVVFAGYASNLVADDEYPGHSDVFLRDMAAPVSQPPVLLSRGIDGTPANGASGLASMSRDGSRIAFQSVATDLVAGDEPDGDNDMFIADRDATTGSVAISKLLGDGGAEPNDPSSDTPVLSPNGRYVAWSSSATNILADDPGPPGGLYLRDLETGATQRVDIDEHGAARGSARPVAVSDDGTRVAYVTGNAMVDADTNGRNDVYVRHTTGHTQRISRSGDGDVPFQNAHPNPTVSADFRFVAFSSWASDLQSEGSDGNGTEDVFLWDRAPDGSMPQQPEPEPEPCSIGKVTLSVGDATTSEGTAGAGGSLAFVIQVSATPDEDVTVAYETRSESGGATEGSDYAAATGTVTFPAGTEDLTRTVQVQAVGDPDVEPDESLELVLSAPTGPARLGDAVGTGTVINDDGVPPTSCGEGAGPADRVAVQDGNAWSQRAPASVDLHECESDTWMRVFNERQGVRLTTSLKADVPPVPGSYQHASAPGTTIAVGTRLSSHLVHMDKVGTASGPRHYIATLRFDEPILGVIIREARLDASDALGAAGTAYPPHGLNDSYAFARGFDWVEPDTVTVIDAHTLRIDSKVGEGIDQVRVITATPGIEIAAPELEASGGRWQPHEWTVSLNRNYDDPFDPDRIAVDATFTSPSGVEHVVPAFWDQDFQASGAKHETYTPVGTPHWTVRFTPPEAGTWTWSIRAQDTDDDVSVPQTSFVVAESDEPGLVRVDPHNPLYLRHADGTPYLPRGHNAAFGDRVPDLDGTAYFAPLFESFERAGENWTRIWMTDFDRTAIEWRDASGTGFYGAPGRYSLQAAWRIERILDLARARGLQVQLVLNDHGQFRHVRRTDGTVDGRWKGTAASPGGNPYRAGNGGPVADDRPDEFFTDPEAKRLYKQRLRYLVARYGHLPNLLAWELWNEVHLVAYDDDPADDAPPRGPLASASIRAAIQGWHAEMSAELRALDPYDHLITTSSAELPNTPTLGPIWALPHIDLVQVHAYNAPTERAQRIRDAVEAFQDIYGKPVLYAETGMQRWECGFDPEAAPADPSLADEWEHLRAGTLFHNAIWAAALSESMAGYWWWGCYVGESAVRNRVAPDFPLNERHFPALNAFLDTGEDRATLDLDASSVSVSGGVAALGLDNGSRGYLWVRDALEELGSGASPGTDRVITGATVTVAGLHDGTYRVERWRTRGAGGAVDARLLTGSGGSLVIPVPDFTQDVAFTFRRVSADLSIEVSASSDPVEITDPLVYTVKVRHGGADEATGVATSHVLSPEVAFVSAETTTGTCSGGSTVTCDLGTMGPGAEVVITITVDPIALGTALHTATITSDVADPAPGDDADQDETTIVDTVAPTGSVVVAGGAAYARGTPVTLTLTAADAGTGVTAMRLSGTATLADGLLLDGVTVPFATSHAWSLDGPDGTRTVWVQFRDGAGNWSAPVSDAIVLDRVAPMVTAPETHFVLDGVLSLDRAPLRTSWSGTDATSGVAGYEVQVQQGSGPWAAVATTQASVTSATKPELVGHDYRYRVRARDAAGNISGWTAGAAFNLTAVDDAERTAMRYQGQWAPLRVASAYRGTLTSADPPDGGAAVAPSVRYGFLGREVAVVGPRAPGRGSLAASVDGVDVGVVSQAAGSVTAQQIQVVASWPDHAVRDLRLQVVGTSAVRLDAFLVLTKSLGS